MKINGLTDGLRVCSKTFYNMPSTCTIAFTILYYNYVYFISIHVLETSVLLTKKGSGCKDCFPLIKKSTIFIFLFAYSYSCNLHF